MLRICIHSINVFFLFRNQAPEIFIQTCCSVAFLKAEYFLGSDLSLTCYELFISFQICSSITNAYLSSILLGGSYSFYQRLEHSFDKKHKTLIRQFHRLHLNCLCCDKLLLDNYLIICTICHFGGLPYTTPVRYSFHPHIP